MTCMSWNKGWNIINRSWQLWKNPRIQTHSRMQNAVWAFGFRNTFNQPITPECSLFDSSRSDFHPPLKTSLTGPFRSKQSLEHKRLNDWLLVSCRLANQMAWWAGLGEIAEGKDRGRKDCREAKAGPLLIDLMADLWNKMTINIIDKKAENRPDNQAGQ